MKIIKLFQFQTELGRSSLFSAFIVMKKYSDLLFLQKTNASVSLQYLPKFDLHLVFDQCE